MRVAGTLSPPFRNADSRRGRRSSSTRSIEAIRTTSGGLGAPKQDLWVSGAPDRDFERPRSSPSGRRSISTPERAGEHPFGCSAPGRSGSSGSSRASPPRRALRGERSLRAQLVADAKRARLAVPIVKHGSPRSLDPHRKSTAGLQPDTV
jgi:hypothetical protein